MDLESTNGTTLNGDKLESARYFELIDKDVLKFGFSGREFVLIKDWFIKKKLCKYFLLTNHTQGFQLIYLISEKNRVIMLNF